MPVLVEHHQRVGGGDAAAQHGLEGEQVPVHREGLHDRGDRDRVGARVHECAEGHVARGPGEAVEPGGADATLVAGSGTARKGHAGTRRMRAIAHAAPKPLSTPTTVTPLAHDACIASSAVTPSSPEP